MKKRLTQWANLSDLLVKRQRGYAFLAQFTAVWARYRQELNQNIFGYKSFFL